MAMSEQQMVEQVERNILSAFKKLGIISENIIFKLDLLHAQQKHEREEEPGYTPSTLQME